MSIYGFLSKLSRFRQRLIKRGPVSVVITCRNYGQYLEDSFLSALNQTRRPNEIIIVDDASTDITPNIAEHLVDRTANLVHARYLRNELRMGVAGARNRGIKSATSEYVMVLDADDRLERRYMECVASLLDEDSKVGIAYSSYKEFGGRNRTVFLPPFDPVVLLTDCIIMGCAVMRRSAWEAAGGYDSNQIFEDWELWIRMVREGWKASGCRKPLYLYRVHSEGKDTEANKQRLEGERRIYEKHLELYKSMGVTRLENGEWKNARYAQPYR